MSFFQELTDREHVFEFLTQVQSPVDVRHGPILYLEDVNVSFDGFKAINNLNLTIDDGELRCIIGPNGAGKTTMMDIITGKTRPDTGSVWFGSRHNLLNMNEPDIASLGIGRKFQKPTVFEALTIFENLELAMATDKRILPTLTARMLPEYRERIEEVLETIGLTELLSRPAGILSHGQKQWLEIGMLLMQEPELLMLDEPVAGMSVSERAQTAELLKRISQGRSVLVIEHDMEFVKSIAHRVTVLHQGRLLAEGSMEAVQKNPKVVEVYLGH